VLDQSVTAMAKMIRERKISSVELVTAHIARIQEINRLINAVVELLADGNALLC